MFLFLIYWGSKKKKTKKKNWSFPPDSKNVQTFYVTTERQSWNPDSVLVLGMDVL